MRILLTGANGQLGYELERSLQVIGEIIGVTRQQMDLSKMDEVRDVIRAVKPDLIVNTAAYTAVDKAESQPNIAMVVNGEAPAVMAEEAKKIGASLIHYSTDYVFDGTKTEPYLETDTPCPINVYGATKLAGEQAIQSSGISYLIFRTSWVYGIRGNNFLQTMLRLAKERSELNIVDDQFGAPTWCRTIADATSNIISKSLVARNKDDWWRENRGIFNMTAQGQTTWYGFTQAIMGNLKMIDKPLLKPIASSEYPLPAKRPLYSILSCQKLTTKFCRLPAWDHALRLCQS